MIVGLAKGGLGAILFSPRNSLQSFAYAFGDIMVLIAARS
jgi:hypothetical protein